ncbi:MAG: sugar transferase [Candidatus Marinimicrobia bacterium]|jgi:lipopolysaccharide/colanic/teichoic acid biosynthesis glycosyltransferase|nr:sugar transferase [Candidatus Neomarinimicrobiota bacterium]MBT5856776.1 sugar transferase [Flavobacteriaceae bacterium]MBT4926125.1 sugar transferase [Candidatus Neomarinimicrobiota bacterium]MBT5251553.1 sugar transferase [Candidatus Neomarinimicrobiota bacterium]MBT6839891.1 sugar transferase [Candidatus Neomarinimicrobiota bacterium]
MYTTFKPVISNTLAAFLFIILLPIILILSLLILITDGLPIFFFQKRGGLNEKSFQIIKFRTMKNEGDLTVSAENDIRRTTKIGLLLRKFSLDELPTIFNILKGDMSFVGPRPLLFEYKKLYSTNQKKRFLVKPGITGWAQVNGRNHLSWNEKFNLDIWYVKNQSFLLDLKILLITFFKIFSNKDIDFNKNISDIKFKGNNENN